MQRLGWAQEQSWRPGRRLSGVLGLRGSGHTQGALCLPQQGPQGCFPSAWPPTLCVPTASSPRPAHPSLRASLLLVYLQPSSPEPLHLAYLDPSHLLCLCLPYAPAPAPGDRGQPGPFPPCPGPVPAAWRPALSVVVQLHSSVLGPSPGVGRGVPLCCRSSGPMAPQCLTLSHFCCSSVHVTPHFTSRQPTSQADQG